jgi:hypothetical protein
MNAESLQELEKMADKLLATARKVPPGPDRQKAFESISKFRLQIAALQSSARPTRGGLKAKGK